MTTIRMFLADERGTTAIEYCLIGGSIALAIVAGVSSVGVKLNGYFTQIAAVN